VGVGLGSGILFAVILSGGKNPVKRSWLRLPDFTWMECQKSASR
jgi:hypothetical protein